MSVKGDFTIVPERSSEYDCFAHVNDFTEDELLTKIEEFSNSYSDHGSVEAYAKRLPKIIADVQVLHDTKTTDKLEDIGHKLYLNIGEILRAVDKHLFPPILANNYNLAQWIQACRDKRDAIQTEATEAQALAEETLLVPEHHIFQLRAKVKYNVDSQQLNADYQALTDAQRDLQDSLLTQKKDLLENITAHFDGLYLAEHDAYTEKLARKNAAIILFRAKQTELRHLHANESVLAAFLNAETQIFSVIQKAVTTHCISLKSILQGTARVPTTGEEIPNPWDKQSLCGIACIMHDRFHKRSFVTFNNHLLDAMGFNLSEADTKSNPMKAVAAVQQMMYNWESRDLWNQMSPDYFFSAVLLRSLHPGAPLRHNLLQETQKFLRERSSSTAPTSSDKNPLFTFAVTYLQNIQESRGFVSNNSHQHKSPSTNASPQAPGARYKPGGLELAAAASTTPAATSSPPASTASSTTGPNPYQHEGKTIYIRAIRALPGPVLRTANVYFQHNANGNPKRYLAVATAHDICANCFPVTASPTAVPCKPPCTSRLCTRCNYYGHNGPWCLQTHTTSGVLVPQHTAAPGVPKN